MHDVYEAISIRACGQLDQMDPQALANISFAFATVGFQPATLASAIAFHKVPQIIDAFNLEQLSQLYQVALFLRLEGGGGGAADAQDAASRLPDFWSFEPRLRRAFESQAPNPSRSQRDVAKCLNRIGFNHDFEHVTRQGLCLDMAQPESWLAVEFDGPWHYVVDVETDDFKVLNGRSVFRRRCLAVLGWAVVHVPYFDWDALGGTEDARDEYLKGLIAEKFSGDAAGLYRPRSASTSKSTTSSFSSASSHRDRGNSFARDRGPSFSAREPFSARERGPSFSAPTAAPKVAPKAAAQRPSFDAAPTNGAAGSKTQLFDEAPSNAATGSRTQSFDGASNGTAPRSNGTVPSDGAAGSRTESFDGTAAPSNGAAGPRTMSLDGTAGLATSRRRPPTAHKPLGQRPPPVPAKRAAAVNPFQALDDDDDEDTGAADADEAVSTSSTQDGKAQDGKAQDGKAPAKKSRRRAVKSKPPAASRQSGPPPGSGAQPRDKGAVADAALLCTGLDLTAPDRPCDDDDDGLESVATVD
ncbi:hypothetical protein M885DRAFT_189119 [Pelagophyceae sp. CCMP2097]|nr:hypothetical protein M885DRAFT_189119 [Pelagophyceae sp. CCMP2097]